MKTLPTTKYNIRFRRWSRKRYSMFGSIGKHVTIGNVKKEITEIALTKQQKSLQTTDNAISFSNRFTEEDNPEVSQETILNRWLELLLSYVIIEYSYNHSLFTPINIPINHIQPDEYLTVFTRLFFCTNPNKNTDICYMKSKS